MKLTIRRLVLAASAAAIGGFAVVWLGLVGIGASSGHWSVTAWFLHFAMENSVRTAALGQEVPPLDDEGLIRLGAGHFEQGCAGCHGSPATPPPAETRGMLPAPPPLGETIGRWRPGELFQIVRHGVRFTGMPAWPVAGRDDEVWALVAFLRRYQALDAESYRDLAGFEAGRPRDPALIRARCDACHGPAGRSATDPVPVIAGQSPAYLFQALRAFRDGGRISGIMTVAVDGLDDVTLASLAGHYAAAPPPEVANGGMASAVFAGQKTQAAPAGNEMTRRIADCSACHDREGVNPAFPRLAGQSRAYLANQLLLFKEKRRGGGPFAEVMTKVAAELEEADIERLAAHLAAPLP